MLFKLRSDLDTFYLYLYSCSHQPYNDHLSGLHMLMTTMQ